MGEVRHIHSKKRMGDMNLEKINVSAYIWWIKIHVCDSENRIGKGWANLVGWLCTFAVGEGGGGAG